MLTCCWAPAAANLFASGAPAISELPNSQSHWQRSWEYVSEDRGEKAWCEAVRGREGKRFVAAPQMLGRGGFCIRGQAFVGMISSMSPYSCRVLLGSSQTWLFQTAHWGGGGQNSIVPYDFLGGGGRRVKQVQCGKLAFSQGNRAHFGLFKGFVGFSPIVTWKSCSCYKFQ